jgi:hypothetical protein
MCLYLNFDSEVETAKKDIRVYKFLEFYKSSGFMRSPYQLSEWKLGKTETVEFFTADRGQQFTKIPCGLVVNEGFHSYASGRTFGPLIESKMFLATIPKGTRFIRGKGNQIASLALRIDRKANILDRIISLFK